MLLRVRLTLFLLKQTEIVGHRNGQGVLPRIPEIVGRKHKILMIRRGEIILRVVHLVEVIRPGMLTIKEWIRPQGIQMI